MIKTFSFLLGVCLMLSATLQASYDFGCGWWYAGLHAGVGFGRAKTSLVLPPVPGGVSPYPPDVISIIENLGKQRINSCGFVGGGQVGYNQLLCCNLLAGIELNLGAFHLNRSREDVVSAPLTEPVRPRNFHLTQKVSTNALLTLCPRLGYFCNNKLYYLTAGLAVTDLGYKNVFFDDFLLQVLGAPPNPEKNSRTRIIAGYAVGAGFEYPIGCRLSLFASYTHMEFQKFKLKGYTRGLTQISGIPLILLDHKIRLHGDVVRLGFNCKL